MAFQRKKQGWERTRYAGLPVTRLLTLAILALSAFSPAMAQQSAESLPSALASLQLIPIPNLPLGVVIFPNGKAINLSVGIGSGAFRQNGDAQGRLWALTDRGPNIDCAEAKRLIGLDADQLCAGDRTGRLHPLPGFAPSIYGIDIGPDHVGRINVFLPLKGKSGRPVSGRPPVAAAPRGETVFSVDGKPLPPDSSGVDPEALVRVSDGSFWIAEEYGPSLLHVSQDGTILKRLVPQGSQAEFKDADYEIQPTLPAILRLRGANRGFEGLAISPDETHLYVMMQSALANPDPETMRSSNHLRIFKLERESGRIVGQYLYQIDDPARFGLDRDGRERQAFHVHVSELVAVGADKLLVVERIDRTARIFSINLVESAVIPAIFDNPEKARALEGMEPARLMSAGIVPLTKSLVLDTDMVPGLPSKIEGLAVISDRELIVLNDNDFGIDGVRTQMFRITLREPLTKR